MTSQFVRTPEPEQAALADFLVRTFGAGPTVNSFRSEVLGWKYFSPHPYWDGSRSYEILQDRRIVAHAGVWPLRLRVAGRKIRAVHMIDWAAAKSAPGAGVMLLRKLAGLAEVLVTIGGSASTRSILPKLGYRQAGDFRIYAAVVRPWLQLRTRPKLDWKMPLRLVRNAAWSLHLPRPPADWAAAKLSRFDAEFESAGRQAQSKFAISLRTAPFFEHVLTCRAAEISVYQTLQSGKPRGYFVLSRLGRQVRIAEVRTDDEDVSTRTAACRLAAHSAAQMSGVCEVVAGTSDPMTAQALPQAGFHYRRSDPILIYDPGKILPESATFSFSLLDGDACLMSDSSHPYMT